MGCGQQNLGMNKELELNTPHSSTLTSENYQSVKEKQALFPA